MSTSSSPPASSQSEEVAPVTEHPTSPNEPPPLTPNPSSEPSTPQGESSTQSGVSSAASTVPRINPFEQQSVSSSSGDRAIHTTTSGLSTGAMSSDSAGPLTKLDTSSQSAVSPDRSIQAPSSTPSSPSVPPAQPPSVSQQAPQQPQQHQTLSPLPPVSAQPAVGTGLPSHVTTTAPHGSQNSGSSVSTASTAPEAHLSPPPPQAVAHPGTRVVHQHQAPLPTRLHAPAFDDDESTEPSSAVNSAEHGSSSADPASVDMMPLGTSVAGSFARFLENTRRRISHGREDSMDEDDVGPEGDLDDEGGFEGALICGYLRKLGRNGKWQTRWFETDGECLSYYKNSKRTKLLATLDLEKVGAIRIDSEDTKGLSFTIQVLGRLYHLRADSKAACKDWVITLNRIKEAHMQQGNVKLVNPGFHAPVDLLDTQQSDDFVAPRVVVVANRQRTRAMAASQDFDQLIRVNDDDSVPSSVPVAYKSEKRLSTLGTVVLARWTKRRSSLSRLGSKLRKWALSLRAMGCADSKAVGLDKHVHPPGHDDRSDRVAGRRTVSATNTEGLSGWIGKETSISSRASATAEVLEADDQAAPRARKMSTASEDVRVLS